VFYCRFNVNSKSAARATASLKSFLNGTTFAVIDAR
jgi:hypothetical protein